MVLRQSDTHGDRAGITQHAKNVRRGDPFKYLFGNTCGVFQICARQSDAKLVAATSKNKVCGSNRASKDSCELSQHFVSDRVTAGILDSLKAVYINYKQRQ